MSQLPFYSYKTTVEDCGFCSNKFTDRDSLIVHCSSRKVHKTRLGKGIRRFYVMDRNADAKSMILHDFDPSLQCADCYADVPIEAVQENPGAPGLEAHAEATA